MNRGERWQTAKRLYQRLVNPSPRDVFLARPLRLGEWKPHRQSKPMPTAPDWMGLSRWAFAVPPVSAVVRPDFRLPLLDVPRGRSGAVLFPIRQLLAVR